MLDLTRHAPLLVGNGQLTGCGPLIDQFNFVVRLNQFKLKGYDQHVGTKLNAVAAQWRFCGTEVNKAAQIWWIQGSRYCYHSRDWQEKYAAITGKLRVFMHDQPSYREIIAKLADELKLLAKSSERGATDPATGNLDAAPSAGFCTIH